MCNNFDVDKLIIVDPVCEIDDRAFERAIKGRRYLDNCIVVSNLAEVTKFNEIMVAFSARIGGWNSMTRTSFPISSINNNLGTFNGSIGLIFGREDSGLTNSEIDQCDYITTIPTPSDDSVMNISHAVGLALYEISRKNSKVEFRHSVMEVAKKEALLDFVEQCLPHIWIEQENYRGISKVFKAIIGRSLVTSREGNALVGLFRAITKSLEGAHPPWDNCGKGDTKLNEKI